MKGIISLFEKDPDSEHTDADQLPLLAFASEILAHLPYTALNDPLFIVYHSSSITALDGQSIINQFAELLGGDLCDPNSEEDDIEQAANKKKGNFDPNEFALQSKSAEFGQLCVNACRILPLLQLKIFLRKAYNLSEQRMTEYVPSEKERIHEKGVSICDTIPAFSCNKDPIFDGQHNINWNSAAKVYASFRVLMRDCESCQNAPWNLSHLDYHVLIHFTIVTLSMQPKSRTYMLIPKHRQNHPGRNLGKSASVAIPKMHWLKLPRRFHLSRRFSLS